MADHRLTVVAQITAKDGMEETVKQELTALVGPTRSEKGCIKYELHQSVESKSLFMFYETWASKQDLDEHFRMPYMKAHLKKAGDLFTEPPKVTLWEAIS
jgi:quinol monooxygenase YgiN